MARSKNFAQIMTIKFELQQNKKPLTYKIHVLTYHLEMDKDKFITIKYLLELLLYYQPFALCKTVVMLVIKVTAPRLSQRGGGGCIVASCSNISIIFL